MDKIKECLWYWGDNEEDFKGGFEFKDEAISDAYCYRATCFDDPVSSDGFYLLYGREYKNPDYDPDFPTNDENNPKHLTGKPEYIEAIKITDIFHDHWNTRKDLAQATDDWSCNDFKNLPSDRVRELMAVSAYPESRSVKQAIEQALNEQYHLNKHLRMPVPLGKGLAQAGDVEDGVLFETLVEKALDALDEDEEDTDDIVRKTVHSTLCHLSNPTDTPNTSNENHIAGEEHDH